MTPRLVARTTLVAGALLAAVASLAGSAAPSGSATLHVRVDAREFAFTLSRTVAPAGSTVRFTVRNRGRTAHRFRIAGKRTKRLRPGRSQTIALRVPAQSGRLRFLCTVANHAKRGMRGTFRVTPAAPAPEEPPTPPADASESARLTRVGTFERPVLVTAPRGDERLFVVEQTGAVRVVRDGQTLPEPFLDLRGQVTAMGESGLLSIAFAPDYASSGLVYAFYNSRAGPYGDIRISEFRLSTDPDRIDHASERVLLTIPKPYENHNGGMLQFGPDGYLYASVGDGDPGALHEPGFYAQRRDELLGSILRIDPSGGDPYAVPGDNPFVGLDGVRPEIWAYGLRNPWRFWIDHPTGRMLIGDVGTTSREEVDLAPLDGGGSNFGWPCFEGTVPFDETATCEEPVPPLLDFARADGVCAVIGGVVVRDARIPVLIGRYLYGDLCKGTVTAVALVDGQVARSDVLDVSVGGLSSFGVDGSGRVYVTSTRGDVHRLDPR